jgi:MOSC domain-containing protein YiiM
MERLTSRSAPAQRQDVGTGMSRVVSVNVAQPRAVRWQERDVQTGIFKEPVVGLVQVRRLNLDGDRQADLTVHGGADKAVYAYAAEHYPFWREQLGRELPFGMFGENLTIEGLSLEDEIAIGDRFRIGTAELVVTQPRLPCFKLGIRFGDPQMVKRFLAAGRTGCYLRVEEEGELQAGDTVVPLERHPARVPVSEITRLYARDRDDSKGLRRMLALDALPNDWRPFFEKLLTKASGSASRPPRAE